MKFDSKYLKPPYFIHSDLKKTAHLVRKYRSAFHSREEMLDAHMSLLKTTFGAENMAFPTFNYDFPKTRIFDLENSPSQVGVLTNFALNDLEFKRTRTPMYSFAVGDSFGGNYSNEPFGEHSVLAEVYQNDGTVVMYGTQIRSTFIHYVESHFGPPRYRYDKEFFGHLISNGNQEECSVKVHLRPLGLEVVYNWPYLGNLLRSNKVLHQLDRNVHAAKAEEILQVWGEIVTQREWEVFFDSPSRKNLFSRLGKLGRRFEIFDFEGSVE